MTQNKTSWIPEIVYEETADGVTSHIPFINVPAGEKMPAVVFLFESQETGEFEPDSEGNESPIVEITLHQYADMQILKEGLNGNEYDRVREILGLESLAVATEKGKQINNRVNQNI